MLNGEKTNLKNKKKRDGKGGEFMAHERYKVYYTKGHMVAFKVFYEKDEAIKFAQLFEHFGYETSLWEECSAGIRKLTF